MSLYSLNDLYELYGDGIDLIIKRKVMTEKKENI